MNLVSTIFLAFAMSTDAFAAAVGKGATLHKPHIAEALKTGLIFGVIEAITPLVGWALGRVAAQYVSAFDHWVTFGLLGLLGVRMIREGLSRAEHDDKPKSHSFWVLALTGFATSIDAMAVGAGLAFIDVDIFSTAATIGFATMLMVTIGVMVGRLVGATVGKRAEIVGGVILIGVGSVILAEHLGYLS
ncbi:Integral membrane protein [Candidatus Burkholderia pumila]|uniref:Putative manganese efflux pump MntP n=1 Tax=Candidatus Burkholderia pumila TaxID=1090375 RepID=A0ABR5HLI0_9BURK|nr:Integral membrane protein [Candidatus Burkholderia pumila]